ncbi:MAG: ribonuclease III domain-containing protein [Cyanobium sp.]
MRPERHQQLVAFLRSLGLEPGSRDLAPIEEALSHTSAGRAVNHERLEFLGDAVLRLAAAEFLQGQYPGLSVGRCSALRAQLVSDRWLAELGERCGIEALLHLGPMASGDQAGRATVRAECCEALLGGLYETWGGGQGGLEPVHHWLTPHWQQSSTELLADPDRHNWKSALQEWSQAAGLGLPNYSCEECSQQHGDPRRFRCEVTVSGYSSQKGWGPSRRSAEQEAARAALALLKPAQGA